MSSSSAFNTSSPTATIMNNEQPESLPPCSCDLCQGLGAPSEEIAAELRLDSPHDAKADAMEAEGRPLSMVPPVQSFFLFR